MTLRLAKISGTCLRSAANECKATIACLPFAIVCIYCEYDIFPTVRTSYGKGSIMPRMTPTKVVIRFVFWPVVIWFLLAFLYAATPSIPHGWDLEPSEHLASGAETTRVYTTRDYATWYDNTDSPIHRIWRSHFAIDYAIVPLPKHNTSKLLLGPDVSIDLQEQWSRHDWSAPWPVEDGRHVFPVYLSTPIDVKVKMGDLDGINLPWFRKSDAMLLFWEIHKDSEILPLRLRIQEKSIQLYPDSEAFNSTDASNPSLMYEPLLELFNVDGFNGTKIESRMPDSSNHDPISESPSLTFPLRRLIQAVLVPTGLLAYHILSPIGTGLKVISSGAETIMLVLGAVLWLVVRVCFYYMLVVLIAWVLAGRPHFGSWARSSILTRLVYEKLQGAQQYWPQHDEREYDVIDDSRRPKPLRGPLDFFRSTNPLDDLLVTFESTKRFLEPISLQRRASPNRDGGKVSMPNEIKLDISHQVRRPAQVRHKDSGWQDLEKNAI